MSEAKTGFVVTVFSFFLIKGTRATVHPTTLAPHKHEHEEFEKDSSIETTFGIWHEHHDHQTSWVQPYEDRQQVTIYHNQSKFS